MSGIMQVQQNVASLNNNPKVPRHLIRPAAVYRKALSEFKRDIYVNADWDTSLSTAMRTLKVAIAAKNLKGFIQHKEKDERLEITIYTETQLNCLHKTH